MPSTVGATQAFKRQRLYGLPQEILKVPATISRRNWWRVVVARLFRGGGFLACSRKSAAAPHDVPFSFLSTLRPEKPYFSTKFSCCDGRRPPHASSARGSH